MYHTFLYEMIYLTQGNTYDLGKPSKLICSISGVKTGDQLCGWLVWWVGNLNVS